jgi:hypothetical protein
MSAPKINACLKTPSPLLEIKYLFEIHSSPENRDVIIQFDDKLDTEKLLLDAEKSL